MWLKEVPRSVTEAAWMHTTRNGTHAMTINNIPDAYLVVKLMVQVPVDLL